MNENQLKFLYDNYAQNQGFVDYNEFKTLMENDANRKLFFDSYNQDLGFTDYNEFEEVIGVKKKGVSGQDSDPLTQSLPVKTVPQKIASKGQQPSAKPKPAPTVAAGDPFANQQAAAPVNYDPTSVRDAIKGVREGLDKTYRVAQEGKRKTWPATWNTQQAYSYIKPSVDYAQQMLDKIKDIQDPEIQSLYNDLKIANQAMKDMVGQAWNDGWDESSVNQYIGGLSRDMATKIDQVDRRMAELQRQKPTAQQQQGQQVFRQAEIKAPKKQPLPEKSEQQVKEEEEMAKTPSTLRVLTDEEAENLTPEQRRISSDEFWQRYVDEMSVKPELAKTMKDYASEMALWASGVGRGEKPWEDRKAAVTEDGRMVGYEPTKEEKDYKEKLGEVDQNIATIKMGEYYDANMGKRHENIDFAKSQDNFTKLYDAYVAARSEDPEGEETKTLAKDLRVATSELNKAYRDIELDYLESTSAKQPTLTKENIDRYNKTIAKVDAGQELSDTEAQFLFNTRRSAIDAFSTINNAKVLKLRSKSNVAGYTKGMAELTPLMEEVLGGKSIVQFASEQLGKQARAAMAPIQEEYGKKKNELAGYETELNNLDAQIKQLEAAYQSAGALVDPKLYEDEYNRLVAERNAVYGNYETTYNALNELNKAMETAISPFNTEMSKISDPYNKKIQQLNDEITKLKNQTGVDDSVLAELDVLYKNLAVAKQAAQIANAQFNEQYNSEEWNKMAQEDRKKGGNIFAEFGRGVVSGVAQIGYGLMQLPKAIGLEDADEFGVIDEMYNFSRQLQYESSGSWGGLQGEGVPSYLRTAYNVGNGVTSSLTYAAGGMLAGPATLPSVLTSVATTYVLSAGDNYQKAIDAGMDSRTANAFSTIMTGLQAGAELIYKDVKILDDAIGNTVITNITKNGLSVPQAFKVALKNAPENLKRATKGILWENFEENTALFVEKLAPQAVNAMTGKDYFEDSLTAKDFEDTFITTSGSTFITRLLFRRSRLDPNSRMALFKSVQNGQKAIEAAERIGLDSKKIAQIKKDYEDAKLKLSVVEGHSNWARMNDDQKAYAFDLARQLDELEKAKKQGEKIGVKDDSLNEQVEQTKAELNEALNNPEVVEEKERTQNNTWEVLEAIKNGEDYPQSLIKHPYWNRLSDEQKKEVESLAEDLEEKQNEINGLSEVGLEDQNMVKKRNEIQDKISEILNNPKNDQENIQGVSGEVGVGQEPVTTQPVEGTSGETTEASGVLQTSEEAAQRVSDILSDIYFNEPGGRSGGLLDEGDANAASALARANSEGGNQYSAHGMGKSSIASAFKDLFTLLTKGIDPTRGGGRLYTAPLSGGEQGAGAGVGTATGNAYMDGPFTLVANRGVGSITDVSQIGGIIVNDGLVNARPELLDALRQAFPNIVFESTSNADQLVRQLNEKSQQATQATGQEEVVTTTEAAPETTVETETPTTETATEEETIQEDESVQREEETNPEIIKIEEERAAELEAFENDENLTEIDGEQVLLTPDGRITRDTINEKYDKEVEYQREIESAVAEIKKQQDPEYQEALRKAIDADPKAGTNVHQMAAENILSGMSPNEAIATATEQAAQKARTDKARQAMEREGLVSNKEDVRKAIANVMRALRSTGIRVRDPLPPGKFEEERKKAKASDTAEAWFRSKTGEIVFSQKALEDGWGTTIVFHEGTHPILNIIRNTNRPLYNKAIKGLRAAAKAEKLNGKPNPLKDVEAWVNKAAGKKSQEQQDDEFMTETIARLASGEIEINRMPATLKEKFVEVLNRIAKFMGFKRIFLNSPDYEFRRLANQIATTLAKGEKIEKIVGKRNVKKYHAKFVQPRAIELLMGKENLSKYGLEPGKKYNVRQIYEAFEKRQKDLFGQIDRKDYSEKTMKQLAEWAKDEVMFMMTQFPDESGTGWYTTKFQAALDEVAKIFPELKTDKGQRSLFTMLVAIYSDGTKVEKNMSNAIMAYSDYKRTGVIPNTETGGERNASFNANINEINRLMADFDGDFDAITEYLLEEKTGAELSQDSEENRELSPLEQKIGLKQTTEKNGKKNFDNAVKAAGISLDSKEYKEHEKFIKEQKFTTQWPAEMILPVASRVFGPKLGMFYSNLMGKEGYPTLDRWFSRLFNRYRGDLMPRLTGLKGKEKDTKGELQGVARFKSFIGKPGISDAKAIEEAKDRALKFGSRTKLGDSSKASKMLSPVEKKVGMKQGLDKASKEKFKKAAKAAGIKLTSPEFKAHEQFVKDRTGGFWTELEGKVGFKQGSKDADKKRFDEAAAKLGYGPDSKLYKNHLADKAANTIYKAAFVALNDAPFNSKDRKFMFDTLVEARKMLKKEGVDVTVADIQAILWYYEKKLYVSQGGLESAMGISYQEAAENSVEEYKRNGGVLDTEITEEDLIDEEGETDLEGMDIQPSTPREGGRIGKYDILPGAPTPKNAAGPIPALVDVAEKYASQFGIPYTRQAEYVPVDEEFGTRIADAYKSMKHDPKDPKVKEAFDDLIRQTTDQYNALMDAGYQFTFFDSKTDPYQENPVNAMRDLRENKRMAVYGTYDGYGTEGITGAKIEDNPMLAPTGLQWPDQSGKMHDVTANDLFRAVHDAFGHGLEGAGFRARGEENAWQAHARLFVGPAVAAITSETRGQNSWLNFNTDLLRNTIGDEKAKALHPNNWQTITVGEHNRTAKLDDTIFAEQKTGLLPEWTWTERVSPAMEQVEVTSGSERISKALGIDDTIQPSEIVGRGEKLVRSGEITESDRQIALYAIQNKMGIKTTNADMIRVSKMSPEQKIKLIEDAFQDRVKKMNPAFRDPEFINQPGTEANRFYQNAVDAKNRALALVPKETIQPTEPGRYDKKDIPDLIERAVAGIDADLRKGIPLLEAIENNMTNQDWYPLLTDRQKRQVQTVLETTFEEEIASLPTEKEEAAEIGVDQNIRELTSELEDLYYQIRDGRRNERNRAQARRDEILRGNPKLSYIYKNIDLINAQLEERGLLTKSIGCP